MLKEIIQNEAMDPKGKIADNIEKAIMSLDVASKLSSKLGDGKRLKKILDKISGELEEEVMYVQKGEYD